MATALVMLPQEPVEDQTVVRFVKYDQQYAFAAIKIGERWFVTQDGSRSPRQGQKPKTWEELLDWIGRRNWHLIEVLS